MNHKIEISLLKSIASVLRNDGYNVHLENTATHPRATNGLIITLANNDFGVVTLDNSAGFLVIKVTIPIPTRTTRQELSCGDVYATFAWDGYVIEEFEVTLSDPKCLETMLFEFNKLVECRSASFKG